MVFGRDCTHLAPNRPIKGTLLGSLGLVDEGDALAEVEVDLLTGRNAIEGKEGGVDPLVHLRPGEEEEWEKQQGKGRERCLARCWGTRPQHKPAAKARVWTIAIIVRFHSN